MTAGLEYAKALYSLAEERGSEDLFLGELDMLAALLSENPDYIKILDTPSVSKSEKIALLDEAFASLDEDIRSFLKILAERRELRLFESVKREFSAIYDSAHGIVRVEAVSAVPLSEDEISAIVKKLEGPTRRIIVKNKVEPEILGGLKLRYDGVQLDGSLKTRLDKLSESLKNVIV